MENKAKILSMLEHLPPVPGEELQATGGQVRLTIRLRDRDRLGCLLDRIEVSMVGDEPMVMDPAKAAEKITYLGEPLSLIENDLESGQAILRSNPPREDDGAIGYFELLVDRNAGARLARYEYNRKSHKRRKVGAPLTVEALARLVNDLTELAGFEN